ncbi:MAG: hypothetical protein WA948_01450, partial [Pontixanthobacter sp.]
MKKRYLTGCAAFALCSTLVFAQDAPESLLPPGFENPAPTPAPTPATPRNPQPRGEPRSAPRPSGNAVPTVSRPVIQPTPSSPARSSPNPSPTPSSPSRSTDTFVADLPDGLPSLRDLENMDPDRLDELLGLKPKFDIPPAARRSLAQIGILDASEGGVPAGSLANQPARLVRASVAGIKGPMVSRWGHILLRRALVSRLDAPRGMPPVEFAAMRAAALNRMGEHAAARGLVQDIDTADWNGNLTRAAFDAYLGTSDIVGACPAVQVNGDLLSSPEWGLVKDVCYAFNGQNGRSQANLNRAFRGDDIANIDVLMAQRYAGTAGRGRRAINLEWDDVEELTPWRFAMANALGAEIPDSLLDTMSPYYGTIAATTPMLPLNRRIEGAAVAARRGNLSADAMVDLYAQLFAEEGAGEGADARVATRLREAYIAPSSAARLAAIQEVWGGADTDYARYVLTAYAAARVTPSDALGEAAGPLIASMLTAGLDADAAGWSPFVADGSLGWALIALSQAQIDDTIDTGAIDDFIDDDQSARRRKSGFLVAGLAGLGRIDGDDAVDLAGDIDVDLTRRTKWSRLIGEAARVRNQPLVAYLAAVGMQGEGWDRMTPRHLYHIVGALNRAGLNA